ncbi:MAG: MobA/MobL family protein [Caulobacteraceae bacterium]
MTAAAWRSDQVLKDERLGRTVRMPRGKFVVFSTILLPASASQVYADRGFLWNTVEEVERRRDAQLARIIDVALPVELLLDDACAVAVRFAQAELVERGLAVDLTISSREAEGETFLHAYFMFPTRPLHSAGFGAKLRGVDRRAELMGWRRAWAQHLNAALEQAGSSSRVDHRSNEARGIPLEPKPHVGLGAINIVRRGMKVDRVRSGE